MDNIFAEWNKTDSPGCSVAIAMNGEIIYARGYGMADLDHGIRNRSGTVFHASSLAKQITVACAALLVLSPVLLIIAALIRGTSSGPAASDDTEYDDEGRPFHTHADGTVHYLDEG